MNKYLYLILLLSYSTLAFSQRALIEKTDALMDILESYGAKDNRVIEQEWLVQYFIVCDEYEETDETLYKLENDNVTPLSEKEMESLRVKWSNSKKMNQAIKDYLSDLRYIAVSQQHWEKHTAGTDSVMWSMTFDDGLKLDSLVKEVLKQMPRSTLRYEFKPIEVAKNHPEFRYRIPRNTISLQINLRTDILLTSGYRPEKESRYVNEKRLFDCLAPILQNKGIKANAIEFADNVGTLYKITDKSLAENVIAQIHAKIKEFYKENPNAEHMYFRNVNYKDNEVIIQNVNDRNQRYCLKVGKVGNAYCIATFVSGSQMPAYTQEPSDLFSNPKYIKK